MSSELTQRMVRDGQPVVIASRLQPQSGDNEMVLMGKLLSLHSISRRSGVILDEAGIARPVLRSGPKNVSASQTDSAVVAAKAGMRIRVISVYALAGSTATTLTFNSKPAGAGTDISGLLANGANGGEVLPRNVDGWFDTAAGEGLSVTTGSGAATGLQVNYILVPNYQTDENGNVLTDEAGNALLAE